MLSYAVSLNRTQYSIQVKEGVEYTDLPLNLEPSGVLVPRGGTHEREPVYGSPRPGGAARLIRGGEDGGLATAPRRHRANTLSRKTYCGGLPISEGKTAETAR
jgi:hypothetical protein